MQEFDLSKGRCLWVVVLLLLPRLGGEIQLSYLADVVEEEEGAVEQDRHGERRVAAREAPPRRTLVAAVEGAGLG